jgi:hypothetical protein
MKRTHKTKPLNAELQISYFDDGTVGSDVDVLLSDFETISFPAIDPATSLIPNFEGMTASTEVFFVLSS